MTLAEIADFVCSKVGQTDAESVAAAKSFARQRYQLIWDSALWRDTQCVVAAMTAGTGAPTVNAEGPHLLLPEPVERVLAVRYGSDRLLGVEAPGTLLLLDAQSFDETAEPIRFSPVASALAFLDDVLAIGSLPADSGLSLRLTTEAADGSVAADTVTLDGTGEIRLPERVDTWLLAASKEVTSGGVDIYRGDGDTIALTLAAAAVQAPRRARIRLFGAPATATAVLALCKRRAPSLEEDFDVPELTGCDNALLAYVHADMLERQRQYAKAQLKAQEAAALLAIMRDGEKNQSARITRIIPYVEADAFDVGFGGGFTDKSHW
jgi:hypothetical protein